MLRDTRNMRNSATTESMSEQLPMLRWLRVLRAAFLEKRAVPKPVLALEPDLAIGSDIQADIAQASIRCDVEVWISNHPMQITMLKGEIQRC